MSDILLLISQKKVLLTVLFALLVGVVLLLRFLEMRVAKNKAVPAPVPQPTYEMEIERLLQLKKPEESTLQEIDNFARDFFAKAYYMKQDIEYAEMVQYFDALKQPRAAQFSRKMLEYMYSGEPLNEYKMAILLTTLRKIIEEEKAKRKQQEQPSFMEKLMPWLKKEQQPAPTEAKKEDQPLAVFENVRNLKPIMIKPEPFAINIERNKSVKMLPAVDGIDDLKRIRMHVEERRKNDALT